MQTCSHFYLIYQLVVLMIYNRRRFFDALYVMFSDNKYYILKEPVTHKAVHISLLAVSTTYDVTREMERLL